MLRKDIYVYMMMSMSEIMLQVLSGSLEQSGPISFKVQTDNQGEIKRPQDQLRKIYLFDSLVETKGEE